MLVTVVVALIERQIHMRLAIAGDNIGDTLGNHRRRFGIIGLGAKAAPGVDIAPGIQKPRTDFPYPGDNTLRIHNFRQQPAPANGIEPG